jgi:hypothetical protein
MQLAQHLLRQTNLRLIEIARRIGYESSQPSAAPSSNRSVSCQRYGAWVDTLTMHIAHYETPDERLSSASFILTLVSASS